MGNITKLPKRCPQNKGKDKSTQNIVYTPTIYFLIKINQLIHGLMN